ncbi:ATP-binding cassette domain-containing protein [Desertimonas flava]|uniref:ATP-binding cassette domain-containing protein n=1 Tax=Desertimonas flava TaxID=2064846 RepID=UPI000E350376|nr:ATP-binding cassette domain-containing protein [Desertimonas flava]
MIEVTNLTKHYGRHAAVDDLSFTVKPGVVTGFLGPNGAGKSTTMRMILGLDRPTVGRALVNGRPFEEHRAPLREIGALLDAKGIHPGRPAHAHLSALAATTGISTRRVAEVLDIVGLSEVADRRSGDFSLGMAQRLGIASALLGDPHTVMLDEPVNGLDPEGILWIRNLLKSLAAEGRTVFVSSHLMSEMALTAEHFIIVGQGRLIADMSGSQLTAMTEPASVRVRSPHASQLRDLLAGDAIDIVTRGHDVFDVVGLDADEIGARAWSASLRLQELTPASASLEDIFIDLTKDAVEYHGVTESRKNTHDMEISR